MSCTLARFHAAHKLAHSTAPQVATRLILRVSRACREFELPPDWAAEPTHTSAKLVVEKNGDEVETLPVGEHTMYTFGRSLTCDFPIEHPSASRNHGVHAPANSPHALLLAPCLPHALGTFVRSALTRALFEPSCGQPRSCTMKMAASTSST